MFIPGKISSRKGRRLPTVLTPEERTALLKQPNLRAPSGLRNRCLLSVMLDGGLRASEALNLHVHHIDWMSGKLTVRQGKGKKDRVLWLNEPCVELLRKWRERRRIQTDVLFTTLQGKHIHSAYLRCMVKRYGRKAGSQKIFTRRPFEKGS